ncbi:unnamed protein product [Caenorhabditis nigoni]
MEWSNFPAKGLVLSYLDYEARCNLRSCSKSDLAIVDSTDFVAEKMEIQEIPSQMAEEKSIIRLKIDTFTVWFIGKNEKTRIERAWGEEKMEMAEIKEENRFDLLRRYIDRFLKNGVFEATSLAIVNPSFEPQAHWKIKTSNLHLESTGNPPTWVINWLNTVVPDTKLRDLEVHNWNLEGIAELPLIYEVSRRLCLPSGADLQDEHLERLKATNLDLVAARVTVEGVTNAVQRILRSSGEISICAPLPYDFDPMILIPEEVKFQKMTSKNPGVSLFKIPAGNRILYHTQNIVRVVKKPEDEKRNYLLWPFHFN